MSGSHWPRRYTRDHRTGRNILAAGHDGVGPDGCPGSDRNGCHEDRAGTDRRVVADGCLALGAAVKVGRDRRCSDVDVATNLGVSEVGEVSRVVPVSIWEWLTSTKAPKSTPSSSTVPSRKWVKGPILQSEPILTVPEMTVKGRITVSRPIVARQSMQVFGGSMMLTPSVIQ